MDQFGKDGDYLQFADLNGGYEWDDEDLMGLSQIDAQPIQKKKPAETKKRSAPKQTPASMKKPLLRKTKPVAVSKKSNQKQKPPAGAKRTSGANKVSL